MAFRTELAVAEEAAVHGFEDDVFEGVSPLRL